MVAEMREAHQKRVEEARKKASEDVEVQQRPQHFTVKIRGVVERITYQNPENGYTVLKCAVKSYKELVTVIGSLLDVNVGSGLLIYGNWTVVTADSLLQRAGKKRFRRRYLVLKNILVPV